ncbi:hypothetical protein [Bartonella raoultii]|uniref:Protein-disulfide reductase n=1 Tax=Bartonella raoultii TaxID=1457020 RepID=A0ABS7I5I9_9HYPH|nr:hypothetical protein [Bartonella raoultii]MBX4336124.1 hypothetical protein [Bartonella raoultii]
MIDLFRNYMLTILIVFAFFLSQIVNVNANQFNHYAEQEKTSVSLIEIGKKKVSDIYTLLYTSNFTDRGKDTPLIEGKVEKVFEPVTITLGVFSTIGAIGFGFLTGTVMALFSAIIGWGIGKHKVK